MGKNARGAQGSATGVKQGIPERIKVLADLVGSQAALAAQVEMGRHSIWEYITGRRDVPKTTLLLIAGRFPCSIDWLERGVGEPPKVSAQRAVEAKEKLRTYRPVRDAVLTAHQKPSEGLDVENVRLPLAMARVRQMIQASEIPHSLYILGEALDHEVLEGRACPSTELLVDLAKAYGVKATWLMGLEN